MHQVLEDNPETVLRYKRAQKLEQGIFTKHGGAQYDAFYELSK